MSFTEDELRAFNSILEQRLAAHRRDVEHMLDLRIQNLRRDFEQRLFSLQQEVMRMQAQKLMEQQGALNDALNQKFGMQQANIAQVLDRKFEREQEQQDLTSLAAQLLAIEQLLHQQISQPMFNGAMEQAPRFEAIEVQTDLPWDDLLAIFGKALDERLATLKDSLQSMVQETVQTTIQETLSVAVKDGEHQVASAHMLSPQQEYVHFSPQSSSDNLTTMQEVFHSIEQLERIIESMQVAMTNNHALLANRLFHHQQLPQERAHPASSQLPPTSANHSNGTASHIVPAEQDGQ